MSEYIKKTWADGEPITAAKLNNMETGIAEAKKAAEEAAVSALTVKYGTATLPITGACSLAYGGGRFVALSSDSTSYAYSDNGIVWEKGEFPIETMSPLVVYGGDRFVAVETRYDNNQIFYSLDGITWSPSNKPERNFCAIAYGNGKFVLLTFFGDSYYSEDGITWTAGGSLPYYANNSIIAYGNGKFVALSNSESANAAYSEDGITWTETTLSTADAWSAVTYGNGKFVALSNSESANAAYSEDGITWTETMLPASQYWYALAYGNERFVAVTHNYTGGRIAVYSEDGITWTETTLPTSFSQPSLAFGNGKFVVIPRSKAQNTVYFSHFGIKWTNAGSWIEQNGIDVTASVRAAIGI